MAVCVPLIADHDATYRDQLELIARFAGELAEIDRTAADAQEPSWINGFLPGLDAAALYAFVRARAPSPVPGGRIWILYQVRRSRQARRRTGHGNRLDRSPSPRRGRRAVRPRLPPAPRDLQPRRVPRARARRRDLLRWLAPGVHELRRNRVLPRGAARRCRRARSSGSTTSTCRTTIPRSGMTATTRSSICSRPT